LAVILFFDTETTGFPKDDLPNRHASQPHCVQLAAILTDDRGREEASLNLMIRPEGWEIPDDVASLHGVTQERAERCGVREIVATAALYDLMGRAELVVAHNVRFDLKILGIMYARSGREWRLPARTFCTLEAAAPIVNLPPTPRMVAAGIDGPKKPKLSECIDHFYGEELEGAHDALVDVRACMRIYFEIIEGQASA